MKARRLTEILSVGAVSLTVWSAPGIAQAATPINAPKSIDQFRQNVDADADDPCQALVDNGEELTYSQYVNKAGCQAAIDAAELQDTIDNDTTVTDLREELYGDPDGDEVDPVDGLQKEYNDLLQAVSDAQEQVALADAGEKQTLADDLQAKKDEADRLTAEFVAASNPVLRAAFEAGVDLETYLADNEDDAAVVAYSAAKLAYEDGVTDVNEAQAAYDLYLDDEYATLLGDLESAENDLAAFDLVDLNTKKTLLADAELALSDDLAELARLTALAEAPLAAGVDNNADILAGSDANPAKAIVETSDCLASGAEDCNNDVGQAIVDGVDSLYKADLALGERIDDEEAARIAGDLALGERIDDEEAARIAADEVLQANIDKEVTDRKAADTVLQANIDKEATDRKAADATLTTAISNEASARAAADLVLDNKITNVNNRVTQLGERVDALTKESRQGIAMAMALSAIPTVNYGKFSLGLGVGTFASETAAALGMDFVVSERVKFKIGFTTTGDESGGSAGIAIGF
jgi:hypothetical protein